MSAHRVEATLDKDGTLILTNLPFRAGESVEVIISRSAKSTMKDQYSLRGKPIRYDNPTEPVAEEEWNALK